MALICGIDEAGRGPAIGPMIICGFAIDEKDVDKLVALGVTDSKLLSPKRREELYEELIKYSHHVVTSSPADIDSALLDPALNLNWLEAISTANAINVLKPTRAFVDCPSNNIKAYSDYLKALLNVKCELICEHGADLTYPVAGAASIIAKVTRDRAIEELKLKVGDLGSGYPSDPKTKLFLEQNFDKHPEIFRKT